MRSNGPYYRWLHCAVLLLLFVCLPLRAQPVEPARWSFRPSDETPSIGAVLTLHFEAEFDLKWYMYASDFSPDLGLVCTELSFEEGTSFGRLGELRSPGRKQGYDSIFGSEYTYFTKKAHFTQRIRIDGLPLRFEGLLRYQLCSEVTRSCVLFEEDFSQDNFGFTTAAAAVDSSHSKENLPVRSTDHNSVKPDSRTANKERREGSNITMHDRSVGAIDSSSDVATEKVIDFIERKVMQALDSSFFDVADDGLTDAGAESAASSGATTGSGVGHLWAFFLVAFVAGLAALLTPCVFPLIPMTVTYFTDAGGGRRSALLYGFFIVLVYTLIGFVLAPFMGPELANELATGWIPNVIFFSIFVFFGLSFLGMFEIVLPHSWANFSEGRTQSKGIFGLLFMAVTLVIVTFSCTGPIVGSILVESVGGLKMKPVFGMLGYSLAFALPFSLFALFPKWLAALPKSGGWLNTVKVTLGFLELAFAFKFLSVSDQAYHWGLLDREVYISLWVVIFGLLGLYLLGKLRLPKDNPVTYLSVPRLMVAIAVFSFVVYLIPGMFGAPLKALAGYLPPQSTHDFDLGAQRASSDENTAEALCGPPLYADLLHFPHGLKGYFDYVQGLACARAQNKPLFIDFTGHGCVNCREMEARVWADERVLRRLREDYVLVALYIDERTRLPEEKWYTSAYDDKLKKTIGRQNADLQITRFNNNAQPYYVLLDQEEELLLPPRAYDLSVQGFVDFLDRGKAAYAAKYRRNRP